MALHVTFTRAHAIATFSHLFYEISDYNIAQGCARTRIRTYVQNPRHCHETKVNRLHACADVFLIDNQCAFVDATSQYHTILVMYVLDLISSFLVMG